MLCSIRAVCNNCLLLASEWDKVVYLPHSHITNLYCLLTSANVDRELSISGAVVASSILVGLTTTLILFCSHFHQVVTLSLCLSLSCQISSSTD